MQEDGIFPVRDISVKFQDFRPSAYCQVGSVADFVPYLSVLDALLNVGPAKTAELIMAGTAAWLTWDDMVQSKTVTAGSPEESNLGN